MNKIPKISDKEWQVMKVLWANSPYTANQVYEELKNSTTWKPNTVKTFLSRLVGKKALSFTEINRTYYYNPLVTEEDCIKSEGESFLNRVYDGAINVMLTNFIEGYKLSEKDIEELKCLLTKKTNTNK